MQKALILANGFEGILSKISSIVEKKYSISSVDFIYFTNFSGQEQSGISGIGREISALCKNAEKILLNPKEIASNLRKLFWQTKYSEYDFYIFSSEGEKQFFLLSALFMLKKKNARFVYFDLMAAESHVVFLKDLARLVFRKYFNRKSINLFLNRISRFLRLSKVFGYPDNFIIEPTNFCNLKCRICLTGLNKLTRQKGKMPKENFFRIMDECGKYIRHLNLHFMGEPFLHDDLLEMADYAKKSGVEILEVNTNANIILSNEKIQTLLRSGINMLVFSADGANQNSYEKYRDGGRLDNVLDNINKIFTFREQEKLFYPKLIIQFIVMKHNINELAEMDAVAKSAGADSIRIKLLNAEMGDLSLEQIREFLPEEQSARLYNIQEDKLVHKYDLTKICPTIWDSIVITWDGYALPCCADFNGTQRLGNIFEEDGVYKVWNNKRYRKFRTQMVRDSSKIKLCVNCPGN